MRDQLTQHRRVKKPACLPGPEDADLLEAALAPLEQACAAWRRWRLHHSADASHYTHHRMLPLLSRRFSKEMLTPEDWQFLRGLHRYHWTRNQLLSNCAASILQALANDGIETIVLKGLALAHLTYQDLGARSMFDFDVLVRPSQRDQAVAVLQKAGWSHTSPLPALSADHGCEFRNENDQRFDLHWFATDESRWPGADDDFWQDSRNFELGSARTQALSPTHQLLHVLIHGVKVTGASPSNWVVDAAAMLRSGAALDWEAFVASAQRRRVVLPMHLGLTYLRDELGLNVPSKVLSHLGAAPVNWVDRLYYQTKIRCGTGKWALLRPYLDYLRTERPRGPGHPIGFLRFLLLRWHLERRRQIPGRIWTGLAARFPRRGGKKPD